MVMQGNCAVELKLDECLGRLIESARTLPGNGDTGSNWSPVPGPSAAPKVLSWLNLPTLPAFTATPRTHSDCGAVPVVTPPLSSYARDEALLEVAKYGSKGAQILTKTSVLAEGLCYGNDAEPSQGEVHSNKAAISRHVPNRTNEICGSRNTGRSTVYKPT